MNLFKTLLWDNFVKLGISELFTLVPWLGYGPLGAIVSFLIVKFTDVLYNVIKTQIDLEKIALKNDKTKAAFQDAVNKLHISAIENGIDSKEFKDLRDEHTKKLSDLVHFNIDRV